MRLVCCKQPCPYATGVSDILLKHEKTDKNILDECMNGLKQILFMTITKI